MSTRPRIFQEARKGWAAVLPGGQSLWLVLAAVWLALLPSARALDDEITDYVTIPAGSYIVDMGVTPQTVANGLKPYGMVYDLVVNYRVAVEWAINPLKTKDGIDFTYNAKNYRGGTFIVRAENVTTAASNVIQSWKAQGVQVDGPIASSIANVPVYDVVNSLAKLALDTDNGSIAEKYLIAAGIPASAYTFKLPGALDSCDDLFALPHADPTWATHGNLINFAQVGGYLWAACHAVSVLEDIDDPGDADLAPNMNFLSATGLVLYGSHDDGSPPYTYVSSLDGGPIAQFMGILDSATQSGSEQIFLPKTGGWRPTTKVYVYDPTQVNVPGLSPGEAAAVVHGRAFGNSSYGRVMYEGGHAHDGTAAPYVAAQRAFLNFYFLAGIDRRPNPLPNVPGIIVEQNPTNISMTVSGGSGSYTYAWSSSIGGTFSDPNSASTSFTPPDVTSNTTASITAIVTDSCGRVSFRTAFYTVQFIPTANLSVTANASPVPAATSGSITYTLAVVNNGPQTATNVVVTNTLAAGLTFVSAAGSGWSCSQSGGGVSCTRTTLATNVGSPSLITITAATPGTTGVATNKAAVYSEIFDPNYANNTNSITTPVINGIDLALTKTAATNGYAGVALPYTLTVTNKTPVGATNIVINDILPATLNYASASGLNWSVYYDPPTRRVTLLLPALAASGSSTVTLNLIPGTNAVGLTVTNTATVSSVTVDPVTADNTGGAATSIQAAADLNISKSALFDVAATPDAFIFTIDLINNGVSTATSITVTDVLTYSVSPFPLFFSNAVATVGSYTSAGVRGSNGGAWTIASLAPGSAATLTLYYGGNTAATFTNTARIHSVNEFDPNPADNSSTVRVDKDFTPIDFAILMRDTPDPVRVGSNITYTITVTNTDTGNDWKNNGKMLTVTDVIPPGTTFVSASGTSWATSFDIPSRTLTATYSNDIPKKTAASFTLVVSAPGVPGTITNTADMSYIHPTAVDPNLANDSVSQPTAVVGNVDLRVTKSVNLPTPGLGSNVVFTVTVQNLSTNVADATNVRITETIPAGLNYVSDFATLGVFDYSAGYWYVGTLLGGATATLTLTVNAVLGGAITNVALVSGLTQNDTNAANDTASSTVVVQACDLAVGKTAGNLIPNVGSNVTFTVSLTNFGPNTASNITVSDVLPAGLQYLSHSAGSGSYNSGSGAWTITSLASNANTTLTLTATVTQAGGLTNIAQALSSSPNDSNPTNNTARAGVLGQQVDLVLGKTVSNDRPMGLGSNLVFTIAVTNLGPSTASNVVLLDLLPASLGFVSASPSQGGYVAGTGLWTVGTLTNSGFATLALTATNRSFGLITNTARFSSAAQPESNTLNNAASVLIYSGGEADLYLTKSVDNAAPLQGSVVVFTLTLENNGPDPASGVIIRDVLPAGLRYLSNSAPVGTTYTTNTGDWTVGTLTNGQTMRLTISVLVTGLGSIDNTATIFASNAADPDTIGNSATSSLIAAAGADLIVLKSGPTNSFAGSNLTYTLTLTNAGFSSATNAILTDTLPAGATFVSASGGGTHAAGVVTWPTLATFTNTATTNVTVTITAPASGMLTNIAAATSATPDAMPANNNGSAAASRAITTVAQPTLSGTVFEDVNYGGGAGRTMAAAAGAGVAGARVELYSAAGNFIRFTNTSAGGGFSFPVAAPSNYTVRVVNSSVLSTRPGSVAGLLPVQTFRTIATNGITVAAPDYVGGEVPHKVDADNGSTTLAALTTGTTAPQSITAAALTTSSVSGLEFGFNFDTIVNTNSTGQGSLAQFFANASALGGEAALAQSGNRMNNGVLQALPAGKESSLFMISDGAAHPGLRAGLPNQLNASGVAVIVGTGNLTLTAANAPQTVVDGTTQTANVGDSNPGALGSGGTVGVDGLVLPTVQRPEVQIEDVASQTVGVYVNMPNVTFRGLAILGFNNANIGMNLFADYLLVEQNVLGATATSFTDPGAGRATSQHIAGAGIAGNIVITNNLIGFASNTGIFGDSGNNSWQIVANEIRGNSTGIEFETDEQNNLIQGNLIVGSGAEGIQLDADGTTSGSHTINNNTILACAAGGIALTTSGSAVNNGSVIARNVIASNSAAGLSLSGNSAQNTISRNRFFGNTGFGIDLAGVSGNNGTTAAGLGNSGMDYPVFTMATLSNATLYVSGYVGSTSNQAAFASATIELFKADNSPADQNGEVISGDGRSVAHGEGRTYLGTITADASGNFNTNLTVSGLAVGEAVTATAIDASGNTSEFGANATVTLSLADVRTTKTGPATVIATSNLTYTITVTNLGPAGASNVIVSDLLPTNVTFVSASSGGTNGSGTVTWPTMTNFVAGATTNFTVTIIAPTNSVSLTNTVSSTATSTDPDASNNNGSATEAQVISSVTASADLAVTKTGPASVVGGTSLSYTITVTNKGPSAATELVVTDTLPGGVTFVSASAGGTNNAGVVGWPALPSFASGATTNLTVTVIAPASGTLTNTATASSDVSDGVGTNNTGSAVTTVTPYTPVITDMYALRGLPANNIYRVTIDGSADSVVYSNYPGGSSATLAMRPSDGVLFYVINAVNGAVYKWDPATPAVAPVAIGSVGAGIPGSLRLAFGPDNTLYYMVGDNLYAIDQTTGAATLAYTITGTGGGGDMAFAPDGTLYFANNSTLYRFSPPLGNAAATVVGAFSGLTSGSEFVVGLGWDRINVRMMLLTSHATLSGYYAVNLSDATCIRTGNATGNGTTGDFASAPVLSVLADVSVTKTGATNVVAGSNLTYTITVTNLGPATASNVVVSDVLPTNTVFVSATGDGSYSNGVVIWGGLISFANTATTNFTVTLIAPAGGWITNTVSSTSSISDPIPANNDGSASAAQVISSVTANADVATFKSGATNVTAGSNLTYTISVTNLGPSTASNVVVSDVLPTNTTFVSAPGGSLSNGVVTWSSLTNLAASTGTNFTVTVTAPAGGSITNTASSVSSTADPDPGNNDGNAPAAQVISSVSASADVATFKTGATNAVAGSNLTYTITVTNLGPSTASNVVVFDTLPTNAVLVSAGGGSLSNGVVTWSSLTNLSVGTGTNFTVTVTAPAGGSITNTASSTAATPDPDPGNNNGSAAGGRVVTVVSASADLFVLKSGLTNALVATNLTYTIAVTNLGPSDATNVVVSDTLPVGASFVSVTGGGILASNVVSWAVAALPFGLGTNFTLTVMTPSNAATLTNIVSATSPVPDPAPANNDGSAAASRVITAVGASADLTLAKSGPMFVIATSNTVYTITVTNLGPSTASNVIVSDILPGGVTFVSASGGGTLSSNVVTWPALVSLTAGAVSNFTVTVAAPASSGTITNIASLTSTTPDPSAANNDGSAAGSRVVTTVNADADLFVAKTGPGNIAATSNLTYTISVTNLGPGTASNVVVSDVLPAGAAFVSADSGGTVSNNIVTWPVIPLLPAGTATNYSVTLTAPPMPGSLTNVASATSSTSDPNASNNDGSASVSRVVTAVGATGASISGFVYFDVNHNGFKDGAEAGTGLGGLFAKIFPSSTPAGPALVAVSVDPASGYYAFSNILGGVYHIVIDTGATLSDVTPNLPAGWSGIEMPSQFRTNVALTAVNLPNQNFGLVNALTLNGRVFKDTGQPSGTANDGILNGSEAGLAGVIVKLTDFTGSTIHDSATTDGAGNYALLIPNTLSNGVTLKVVETNPNGFLSSGASVGTTGGTYARTNDTVTFTYSGGAAPTGVNFGDVPLSTLAPDGQQSGLPGAFVLHPHTFVAGSGGQVTFSVGSVPSPNIPGWNQVIYRDANCNAALDPGEVPVTAAITVVAGEQVCLLVKDFIPVTAPLNAQNQITLTAAFAYTGASPALGASLVRMDITTVGNPTTAGLTLLKTVDKATALPGEIITYTITYANNSAEPLASVIIYDATPAFTAFLSATNGVLPADFTALAISAPGTGGNGAVKWTFDGTLGPGRTGTVEYKVNVAQ